MEMDEILKNMDAGLSSLLDELNKISKVEKPRKEAPASSVDWKEKYTDLLGKYEKLEEDYNKLRAASIKLLEDFDKINTKLRDAEKSDDWKEKFETADDARKHWYNTAATKSRQVNAYSKALGTIHGALELLEKELK